MDEVMIAVLLLRMLGVEEVAEDDAAGDALGARRGSPQPPVLGAEPGNEKPPADDGGLRICDVQEQT